MPVRVIPVAPSVPNQRLNVTLDKRKFTLDLRWSMRGERWYLDIRDVDGAPILMGTKLVASYPLLSVARRSSLGPRLPPGDLVVTAAVDPTLAELGTATAQLCYIDAAELAALASSRVSVAPGSPVIRTRPLESGTRSGDGLTAYLRSTKGVWSGRTPMRFEYQWFRGVTAVTDYGATTPLLSVPVGSGVYHCRVTATNAFGVGEATSGVAA